MVIARTLLPNPPFIARSPRVRRNASGFFQVAVSTFTTTDAPTCNHRVVDDAIRAFVAEARAYCLLIEGNDSPNSWGFAQACLAQLLRLYQHALLLPEVQPETTELLDSIEHESRQRIREQVARAGAGPLLDHIRAAGEWNAGTCCWLSVRRSRRHLARS